MADQLKIAVVTPIPTPYRDRFWNVVAAQDGVSLDVYFCAKSKPDRPWEVNWPQDFNALYPSSRNLLSWRGPTASCYWNSSVSSELTEGGYNAVLIGGYNHLTMLSAIRAARTSGTPWYLMCESNLSANRSPLKSAIKDFGLKRLLKSATGGLPTGSLASEYLKEYGFREEQLFQLPNVPDVESLRAKSTKLANQRASLRRTMKLRPDSRVLLFVGRFIRSKGVVQLMHAFEQVAASHNAELVMVGDGGLRPELEELRSRSNHADRVHFPGFVPPEEIAKWFCVADAMVHPSKETWGVAILEAVASGLPVLVSVRTGCARDVIVNDMVGRVIEDLRPGALASEIAGWLELSPARDVTKVHAAWQDGFERYGLTSLAARLVQRLASNVPSREAALA